MTLLCGALSWLSDQYNNSILNNDSVTSTDIDEPKWLKNIRNQKKLEPVPETSIPEKRTKKVKIEPSNLDERISNLVNLLDDSEYYRKESNDLRTQNFGQKSVSPKIIFCSRTHSQLSQVASELKKTPFFKDKGSNTIVNLATSIASRKRLCINKSVNSIISPSALNDACNDLLGTKPGCPYYNQEKNNVFKEHLDVLASKKILDIEEILNSGTISQCCPYYSSRHLIQPASFVIAPYNVVLDKVTREAYGISLTDNIVIFDEAHNIVDFIKQMNSIHIRNPGDLFGEIVECIEEYMHKYGKRIRGSNSSALSQLQIFFSKISNFIKKNNYGSFSVNEFTYLAEIESFNFSKLSKHAEETSLFTKVSSYYEKHFI